MPRVVHFEIPAANPARAIAFYREVFGWEIRKYDGAVDYWLATTGKEGTPGIDGAIMPRNAASSTVNTIEVPSLDEFLARIGEHGGKRVSERTTIPGVGLFCYCQDSEGNLFGLLESGR